ncbi:TIGR04283 family arsenosugar biosynthesis glycosyltransferase [Hymenobacter sp. BT770]|uniref:TIGR04283 family arsenosugar biosynthesis glycosyltransferase n=1 Tax=Hymenobacter sp. BT770 TaxID=2886942 RepID=UPI001D118871|nr:TIGR04283 family arsenosugar biosynthesis glycosyltransferase [Hymenobacter sp. BT770]MCC3155363.1 TIGR04283 family arsenosugar biosynthesis glycosyltransferase [Hymenobacter sp. BT770]MDO3417409.1 TIGR04283 family arsenosugar biosynthesis glycosyltransferase [Hymenobacter sp. BT770]
MPPLSARPVAAPALVSIVIPTFNEAEGIVGLLRHLAQAGTATDGAVEIIVADGGSTDATAALARQAGACVLACPTKGRAAQLNFGARLARGSILYFLHADTFPPAGFLTAIRQAVTAGYGCGCFRLAFDEPHWFLRANAWFTRFNVEAARFGDQSLFVTKPVFEQAGGYREDLFIMEDQEITRRLRQHTRLRVLPATVITSARKYRENGVFRLQGVFYLLTVLYRLGVSQPNLLRVYRALIRQNKL